MTSSLSAPPAEPEANLADFDFVVEKVTANYAGYENKVTDGNRQELAALTSELRAKAELTPYLELLGMLQRWLSFFRDRHLRINVNQATVTEERVADFAKRMGMPITKDEISRIFSRMQAGVTREQPALRRLSPATLLIRIPDFHRQHAALLKSLLETHASELDSTPNLIIDVRRNAGGSDRVYKPLIPLLYTHPIYTIGVELRASADNIALRQAFAASIKDDPDLAAEIEEQNRRMADNISGYVPAHLKPLWVSRRDTVRAFPKHVAILIDGAASSGEQFLLEARQSRKVTLFGQRNSAGMLDFANVNSMDSPSGRFTLWWGTSRSLRLPDDPVDPDGIPPDVRIPDDTKDPVKFAQRWLERRAKLPA